MLIIIKHWMNWATSNIIVQIHIVHKESVLLYDFVWVVFKNKFKQTNICSAVDTT